MLEFIEFLILEVGVVEFFWFWVEEGLVVKCFDVGFLVFVCVFLFFRENRLDFRV